MTTRWGIVEDDSYTNAITALNIGVKRLDDLLEGATWLIARAADSDECTTDLDGIRLVKADIPQSADRLRVWFTLDSDNMMAHLISIDIEAGSDTDESW